MAYRRESYQVLALTDAGLGIVQSFRTYREAAHLAWPDPPVSWSEAGDTPPPSG